MGSPRSKTELSRFSSGIVQNVALAMWKCIVYEWLRTHQMPTSSPYSGVGFARVSRTPARVRRRCKWPLQGADKRQVVVGVLHHGAQDTLNSCSCNRRRLSRFEFPPEANN